MIRELKDLRGHQLSLLRLAAAQLLGKTNEQRLVIHIIHDHTCVKIDASAWIGPISDGVLHGRTCGYWDISHELWNEIMDEMVKGNISTYIN